MAQVVRPERGALKKTRERDGGRGRGEEGQGEGISSASVVAWCDRRAGRLIGVRLPRGRVRGVRGRVEGFGLFSRFLPLFS